MSTPDATSSPALTDPAARRPLGEVWSIAWPTVLTMTSYTLMQFVDSLMVGQVGALEVAAQGNGGIWAFAPIAVAMGFLTVINTYVSQNLGAGRPERGPQYAWAGLWLSVLCWLVVMLPMAAALPLVFPRLHDPADIVRFDELVAMETGYGQILLLGAIITLASRVMHHYFFGLHRPKIITVSSFVGNITNVIANYVLIFGEQGLPVLGLPGVPGVPALGIYGAAIGTVIGTSIELAIPAAIFLGPKMNAELQSRRAWWPQLRPMRELIRIGTPAAVQYGNELICWAVFMTVLVGEFGAAHMTAGWIALRYMHLSFMPAIGFSVAVTSLVGKYIGAGEPDTAVARARLGLAMAIGYMTLCGVIFWVFRHPLVEVFLGENVPPELAAEILVIGGWLMICAAVFQTIDAVGIVYTGALRGAGDTVFPGIMTVIYSWTLIVGGGWFMIRMFPALESIGPWIAAAVFIAAYGVTMAWRFEAGRWRSIKLLGGAAHDAAEHAPLGPTVPTATPDASISDLAEEIGEEHEGRAGEDDRERAPAPATPGGAAVPTRK